MQRPLRFIFAAALLGLGFASAQAATLVASYSFNDTLAANQAGKPSLVSVDPLGLNSFETAVVNGASQRVFHWNGNGSTPTNNAGLRLDATGLVSYDNYSVEMTFEFTRGVGLRRRLAAHHRYPESPVGQRLLRRAREPAPGL